MYRVALAEEAAERVEPHAIGLESLDNFNMTKKQTSTKSSKLIMLLTTSL